MAGFKSALLAVEKRIRRRARTAMSKVLALFGGARGNSRTHLDPALIHSVLVARMNGRMGNTLFLTPLLAAIHEVLPHAAIDVFVSYPDAADVLRGLPGLRNVITLPHMNWWNLPTSLRTLKDYRSRRYDLVIDPVPNSSGGRIALLLSRARWRLGFTADEQWLRLDYAAELPPGVRHEALRPLALMQQAFGYQMAPGVPRLRVANSSDEFAAGARLIAERMALAARRAAPDWPTIGFFASARGKKDLGPQWWREFWQAYLELRPQTAPLEVLPTADHPPVNSDFANVHCPSPRQLAATISHADGFFSADTGPMHLASAAGVPTIAFFEQTNPAAFGPIKPEDAVLKIAGMTPRQVAEACAGIVASRTAHTGRQS
jgi:ADP-heptose:LPS heptosyltransferase